MAILQGQPNRTYVAASAVTYIADGNGIIPSVSSASDVASLVQAGCVILTPSRSNLLGSLIGANFNPAANTDQQVLLIGLAGRWRITKISVTNTSLAGMSTAAGGFYTATSKGGTAIVAAAQVYTGLTNAATVLDLTLAVPTQSFISSTPLYLNLTTAQGVAATADIYVYGDTFG
jgi:hypothetical protein